MATNQGNANDSQVLLQIGEKLYLKPKKADVYFTFDTTDERIPAHKILLSSGSDVFEAMFYGSLKEESDIKIVDASAEAFKEFLRIFYFNKINLSIENVAQVMYLGKKYNVDDCLRLCSKLLTNEITTENVISALGLAIKYDQLDLNELCESEICSNSSKILQLPSFLECDRQILTHILNMEGLSCSETEVFEACMSWVRAISQQGQLTRDIIQTHLGDLFFAIRFGSMSMDEFVKLVPLYGNLFSGAEYKEIIEMISKQENQPKLFKGCRSSGSSHNSLIWDEIDVIKCNLHDVWFITDGYSVQIEEITTFSSNTTLLYGHFVCAPLYHKQNNNLLKIKNIHASILADSNEIQSHFHFDYSYSKSGNIVRLPKPVIIKPGVQYEIRLTFPSKDYFAFHTLKSNVVLEQNIVIQFGGDRKCKDMIVGVIFELGFNLFK